MSCVGIMLNDNGIVAFADFRNTYDFGGERKILDKNSVSMDAHIAR